MDSQAARSEGLTVTYPNDCGNAPKKIVLREFNIAYASQDMDYILANVTNDVHWHIVGEQQIRGEHEFSARLNQTRHGKVKELHIHKLITHGKTGAVNGTITYADRSRYAYCAVYEFNNSSKKAKIKEITTYTIRLDDDMSD